MRRENDDRDVAVDRADLLQDLDAVELRHHQVQDHHVVITLTNLVFDERGIANGLDDEAILLE